MEIFTGPTWLIEMNKFASYMLTFGPKLWLNFQQDPIEHS